MTSKMKGLEEESGLALIIRQTLVYYTILMQLIWANSVKIWWRYEQGSGYLPDLELETI